MTHLFSDHSFSFFLPARLARKEGLPELQKQLMQYRKEAAEGLQKTEAEQNPTFSLKDLKNLRAKFETEFTAGSLSKEERAERMAKVDALLRLPEAFVLDPEKAKKIREEAQEALFPELTLNVSAQKDTREYDKEVDNWIDKNITSYEGADSGNTAFTNKARQSLRGLLLAARATLGEEDPVAYENLRASILKTYKDKWNNQFTFSNFEDLSLFDDNSQNAGYARNYWLLEHGLNPSGVELLGYEDEAYLTGMLMAAEHYFKETEDAMSDQFYQLYKADVMASLVRLKPKLRKLRAVRTDVAEEGGTSWYHVEDWNSDSSDFETYKSNYNAQRELIHKNVPMPAEWFAALKASQENVPVMPKKQDPTMPEKIKPPEATNGALPGGAGTNVEGRVPQPPKAPDTKEVAWDKMDPLVQRFHTEILPLYSFYIPSMGFIYGFGGREKISIPKAEKILKLLEANSERRGAGDAKFLDSYKIDAKFIDDAKTEFLKELKDFFAEYQKGMVAFYKKMKENELTGEQRKAFEALEKADFSKLQATNQDMATLVSYGVPFYILMELQKPAGSKDGGGSGGAADKTPRRPGEEDDDEDDGDDDTGGAGRKRKKSSGDPRDGDGEDGSGGGKKRSKKGLEKKEEGPTAEEILKNPKKYCIVNEFGIVHFEPKKAEKVMYLRHRFPPEGGKYLFIAHGADLSKAQIAEFDGKTYKLADGGFGKFFEGSQVLQGDSAEDIAFRYEKALSFQMPESVSGASEYLKKAYTQLESAKGANFPPEVAYRVFETLTVHFDKILKEKNTDEYVLDLSSDLKIHWKNPGSMAARQHGFALEDMNAVRAKMAGGSAQVVADAKGPDEKAAESAPGERPPVYDEFNKMLKGEDTSTDATDAKAPEDKERALAALKNDLQNFLSEFIPEFRAHVEKGAKELNDHETYLLWQRLGTEIQRFEKKLEDGLKKVGVEKIELNVPGKGNISFENRPETGMSLRDFASYAGMIDDAKRDTPFYKFIEKVEGYLRQYQ